MDISVWKRKIGIISSAIAAILWFVSTIIPIPKTVIGHVVTPHEVPLGGNPIGGTYVGQIYSEDMKELVRSLRIQSRLSACAAFFSGLSVICAI